MADPIRVLLVDLPRLPRELIQRAVAAEDDMLVVGSTPDLEELPRAVAGSEPEFVIVGLIGDKLPPTAERFVQDQARLKVLGVEAHEGKAFLYELRPERAALGEVSPADVVAAIRRTAAPARSSAD
jgi:DNA-binding NarL/FixJ family response regulator